ncbi:MAG: hypothetical protein KME27_05195 [Lyngbya sp. HA4199-MV5]|nr:hypothetical protein [Lyngbya sp. HA4199-MV5]
MRLILNWSDDSPGLFASTRGYAPVNRLSLPPLIGMTVFGVFLIDSML